MQNRWGWHSDGVTGPSDDTLDVVANPAAPPPGVRSGDNYDVAAEHRARRGRAEAPSAVIGIATNTAYMSIVSDQYRTQPLVVHELNEARTWRG